MRIAVVTQFYPPEPCAAATRVASLVDALARIGHDVTVVTNFASFPSGRYAPEDRRGLRRVERAEGVTVVRLRALLVRRLPGRRFLHWVSAAIASSLELVASRVRYDAIVVSMPPITLALPALAGAARHRARLVVDVRDVFPDIAIAMGEWRAGGFLARTAEHLVRALYRRADLVVAVTPTAIEQIAERGVPRSRLMLARNAAEIAACPIVAADARRGFTAIYAGNLGLATDVDLMLDAASLLANDDLTIELVGGGALREHVAERIRSEGLRNVILRESVARDEAMRLLAGADVAIVPLRKGIKESVPTKLYDAFSVGCPAIVAADGEARSEGLALGARCVAPGDAQALAAELRALAAMGRDGVRALGERGRSRLQERADRAGIMAALAGRISALA